MPMIWKGEASRAPRACCTCAAPGRVHRLALIFSLYLREQPMSAILTQSGTEVMSSMVLQFIEDGSIALARIFVPRDILGMR